MKILLFSFAIGTQLVTPVADRVPIFNVEVSCKGASSADRSQGTTAQTQSYDACMSDEESARQELTPVWLTFSGTARDNCEKEASGDGLASYVELLTCLQLARNDSPEKVTRLKGARRKK